MDTMLDFFDDDDERFDAQSEQEEARWSWRVAFHDDYDDVSFDVDDFLGDAGWDELNW